MTRIPFTLDGIWEQDGEDDEEDGYFGGEGDVEDVDLGDGAGDDAFGYGDGEGGADGRAEVLLTRDDDVEVSLAEEGAAPPLVYERMG